MKKPNQYKKFIEWLDYCVNHIKAEMQLGNMIIYIAESPIEKDNVQMSMSIDYPYRQGKLNWSQYAYDEWKKGDQNKQNVFETLIHEITHKILDRYYTVAKRRFVTEEEITDVNEETTEHIALILSRYIKCPK